MLRLNAYINQLVSITIKNKLRHDHNLSGWISAIGKDNVLFLDQDKVEHSFKKDTIIEIKCIKRVKSEK